MPRWRPCGTFWRMAKRLRAHSTRLILDWPPLRAYIASALRATVLYSPLLLIPLRGHGLSQNRRIQPLLPFFSHFFLLYLLLSFVLSCCFLLLFADSVTRNGIAIAPSELVRLREWSICRATRFELSLFAVLLAGVARELFNLLPCCSFENVFWD